MIIRITVVPESTQAGKETLRSSAQRRATAVRGSYLPKHIKSFVRVRAALPLQSRTNSGIDFSDTDAVFCIGIHSKARQARRILAAHRESLGESFIA